MPGYCEGVFAAICVSLAGKVMGSFPEGLKSPKRTAATALPSSDPGYQASRMAGTLFTHGIRTGDPLLTTTMVLGCAATTCSINESSVPGNARVVRSVPSLSSTPTITMATSELAARETALEMLLPSLRVTVTPDPTRLLRPASG